MSHPRFGYFLLSLALLACPGLMRMAVMLYLPGSHSHVKATVMVMVMIIA
jgi:hypothetical protein